MGTIRTLAIAIIRNDNNQLLLHEAYDSIKNETFYRPLGGGIEFGEKGEQTLRREFREEINQEIKVLKYLNTFENIFTYEGRQGHQIILLYEAQLINSEQPESYSIIEEGRVVGKAVWKSLDEIQLQCANIYPEGIKSFI